MIAERMRTAVVMRGIPNPATSGGALTGWTVIQQLIRRGHRVLACLIAPPSGHYEHNRPQRLDALVRSGAEVAEINEVSPPRARPGGLAKLHRLFNPAMADVYPWAARSQEMRRVLAPFDPQAVFIYEVPMLASLYGVCDWPRFTALGDLDHLPALYGLRHTRPSLSRAYFRAAALALVGAAHQPSRMVRLLQECESVGNFAAHHAAWLRSHGVPGCRYLPTPIMDTAGDAWAARRAAFAARPIPKILMIGHLNGTATQTGLQLFARQVLPVLEQRLGANGFEVHVVGGFAERLPVDLKRLLDRPSIKMRGHVEPADDEFLSSDLLLVPTPIELGIRVRIIVAFMLGSCVVTHRANALGIPELRHGENVLLASDGPALAEMTLQALHDAALRQRLGEHGRRTYDERFQSEVAGGIIVDELERLAQIGVR